MADPAIKGVCAEARRYNFQLFSGFEPLPVASPDGYMDQCQKIFEDAKSFQRRQFGIVPKLVTAAHIRQIGEFTKKRKLSVSVNGYDFASGALALTGTVLSVQARCPFIVPLFFALDHEFGHLRDKRLVAAYAPELESAMKRIKWSEPEMRLYISIIMELMRDGLSQSDQFKFDRLRKEVLGDLDQYDVRGIMLLVMCFAELFRGGEEILDERYEKIMGHPGLTVLKKHGPDEDHYLRTSITNSKGERVDLNRLARVAQLYEANLWEKFVRLPDYDTNSLLYIRPNHLEFSRLCIKGASRHFINTAAR